MASITLHVLIKYLEKIILLKLYVCLQNYSKVKYKPPTFLHIYIFLKTNKLSTNILKCLQVLQKKIHSKPSTLVFVFYKSVRGIKKSTRKREKKRDSSAAAKLPFSLSSSSCSQGEGALLTMADVTSSTTAPFPPQQTLTSSIFPSLRRHLFSPRPKLTHKA
jgi:hypothetical protein